MSVEGLGASSTSRRDRGTSSRARLVRVVPARALLASAEPRLTNTARLEPPQRAPPLRRRIEPPTRQGSPTSATAGQRAESADSRRPSEPAPVSTGEGSHRAAFHPRPDPSAPAPSSWPSPPCSLVGGDATTRATTSDGSGTTDRGRAGHPRLVRDARRADRPVRGRDRLRPGIRARGDAGALTNKLVLTKDNPTGDAVFGIDNTFGSRAIDEGVLAPLRRRAARRRRRLRARRRRRAPAHPGRHGQRLRQRRRHLVRRARTLRRRPRWRT